MMTYLARSSHSLFTLLIVWVAAMIHIPLHISAQEATPGESQAVVADTLTHMLTASVSAARAGETVSLIWTVKLEPTWHIYYQNPGDSGLPPTLAVEGEGITTGPLTFPTPKRIDIDPITNYGYENEVMFTTEFTLPRGMAPGLVNVPVKLEYLYCSDICMPGTVTVDLPLEIAQDAAKINERYGALLVKAQAGMPNIWPVEASARVNAAKDGMALRFTLPDGSVPTVASFIPAEEETILDNAPQPYENGLLLIAKDNAMPSLPKTLKGLLIADGVGYQLPELPIGPDDGAALPAAGGSADGGIGNQRGAVEGGPSIFLLAMGGAFLAGLILNLMPCVLPILAIKVLSAVRYQSQKARQTHATGYTIGVLASFWALALLIIGLGSAGHVLGWGFHLQNPYFVAGLTTLMVALGLNFLGVFNVGESATRLAEKPKAHEKHHAFVAAVGTGVLAVIVSTPCTVPFMGGAMAFALNQSWPVTLAVFTAMGLGLALPFVVLTTLPATAKFLPKPGLWMVNLKQILAWPLFATALWLAYVFANQTDTLRLFTLLTAMTVFAFAIWFYGKHPTWRRRAFVVLTLIGGAMAVGQGAREVPESWQLWSKEAETAARAEGPVFVDFTADWCITCKVVEATVLNTREMQATFDRNDVTLLQGDWTKQDPAITAELDAFGRKGVPLYVLYMPGKEAQVLPQLPTRDGIKALLEGSTD